MMKIFFLELKSHKFNPQPSSESREEETILLSLNQVRLCQRHKEGRRISEGNLSGQSFSLLSYSCDVYDPSKPRLRLRLQILPQSLLIWAESNLQASCLNEVHRFFTIPFLQHSSETSPHQRLIRCFLNTCKSKAT